MTQPSNSSPRDLPPKEIKPCIFTKISKRMCITAFITAVLPLCSGILLSNEKGVGGCSRQRSRLTPEAGGQRTQSVSEELHGGDREVGGGRAPDASQSWEASQLAWICSQGSQSGAADKLDQICIFTRQLVDGKRVNWKGSRVENETPTRRPERTVAGLDGDVGGRCVQLRESFQGRISRT